MGTENMIISIHYSGNHHTVPQFKRRFYGIGQPLGDPLLNNDPVYHDFNSMFFVFLKNNFIGKRIQYIVRTHTYITFFPQFFQKLLMRSFLTDCHRSKNHQFSAVSQINQGIYDLIRRLPLNRFAAMRTKSAACMGIEHTEIIMNFRNRSYCRTRIVAC